MVDDDPAELASTCKVLQAQYRIVTASSGEAALRAARSEAPDMIVLDVVMPGGKDGFAVFSELHHDPATRDIPVVFLTNVNQCTGLSFGCAELGRYLDKEPAAFLEKPVCAAALLSCVSRVLEEARP